MPENEKPAIDKRLENLYNTWAFTNEELDDIRQTMVEYVVAAIYDTKIAEEALLITSEYRK